MNRALNNRNPLNIRRVAGTKWIGQSLLQTDRKYVKFQAIGWGLRAAFCILRTYARKYHAICVRDIINQWAPSCENQTETYIRNVCLWTGFSGNQRLTEKDWPLLVRAMARQECGVILDSVTINRGFTLYKLITN